MHRLLPTLALGMLCCLALFLNVADAHVYGPSPYGGHTEASHCDAVTHLSYYDPRNQGVTAYNTDRSPGDDVYYVDTDPLAGFDSNPDPAYATSQGQDCKGTPVLRATMYVAVTVNPPAGEPTYIGYPTCTAPSGRNPDCQDPITGLRAAVYVATPDGSHEFGESVAVTNPLVDP